MPTKKTIDILEASDCLIGKTGKTAGTVLGFASCVFNEDGGVVISVTGSIPAELEGFEKPSMRALVGCHLLSRVLQAVVRRREIATEAEQQKVLGSARGKGLPGTRLVYMLTHGDELELLPIEDLELLAKASTKT